MSDRVPEPLASRGGRPVRDTFLPLAVPSIGTREKQLVLETLESHWSTSGPRSEEQATDLTLIAGGGPAWSCGYDDHTLPPVRGGGLGISISTRIS